MKYARILTAFAAEPWAMDRDKMRAVLEFLAFKAAGGDFSPNELSARVSGARSVEIARQEGAVALIPVHGVLAPRMDMVMEMSGGMSYGSIQQALHAAIASDDVKAIVLDIDSPGGSVPGAQELAAEIRAVRGGPKPIVAQVNHSMASAAYWIGSQADEVVVTPSGRAGSIGVYTVHDDMSAALAEAGVRRTYIAAGDNKVEGNQDEPLSASARTFMEERVKRSYDRFVADVASGRKTSRKDVLDNFGQGRMFFAEELIEKGMADTVATLEETLARFGADVTPEPVRKLRSANAARAQDMENLVAKLKAGEPVKIREWENGLKGLAGLSNSEAERAVRLCLKSGQGDPDVTDEAAMAAVERALAMARSFKA